MAQRVELVLEDDLDGSAADQTVEFSLDGSRYEVDLTDAHAGELRDALAQWVAAARRTGGRRTSRTSAPAKTTRGGGSTRTDAAQLAEIRRWAGENGYEVSSRGRIPAAVQQAYQAAHSS